MLFRRLQSRPGGAIGNAFPMSEENRPGSANQLEDLPISILGDSCYISPPHEMNLPSFGFFRKLTMILVDYEHTDGRKDGPIMDGTTVQLGPNRHRGLYITGFHPP